jgi:putative transposase
MTLPTPYVPVFHIYNRTNDRRLLFPDHSAYMKMLIKIQLNFSDCAHLLGYCLMPNHFHLLLTPFDLVEGTLLQSGKVLPRQATRALSLAIQRTLMGYTKWLNALCQTTGSRFQQHTPCKFHSGSLRYGLDYVHFNPVKANLVTHPSEWGHSSFNEYSSIIDPKDCLCNTRLGNELLARYIE